MTESETSKQEVFLVNVRITARAKCSGLWALKFWVKFGELQIQIFKGTKLLIWDLWAEGELREPEQFQIPSKQIS